MQEAKHTPGPWLCEDNLVYALQDCEWMGLPSKENRFSAGIQGKAPKEELAANGRLIAAAPDLLNACQRAFHVFENDTPRKCEVMGLIEAAIAKATKE